MMLQNIIMGLLILIIVVGIIGIGVCIICLYRLREVYEYRNFILDLMSEKCKEDILNNRDHLWRYVVFEKVTFGEMVNKFWKPLDSFYEDNKFLQ